MGRYSSKLTARVLGHHSDRSIHSGGHILRWFFPVTPCQRNRGKYPDSINSGFRGKILVRDRRQTSHFEESVSTNRFRRVATSWLDVSFSHWSYDRIDRHASCFARRRTEGAAYPLLQGAQSLTRLSRGDGTRSAVWSVLSCIVDTYWLTSSDIRRRTTWTMQMPNAW